MNAPSTVRRIKLHEDELERLERRLTIASSNMKFRDGSGAGHVIECKGEDLTDIADEIVENFRNGVDISTFAESRPLIPMFKLKGRDVPLKYAVDNEKMKYDFYLVELAFRTMLANDQYPVKAQLDLALQDDVQDKSRQLRPVSLFPGRTDVSLFKMDLEGGVGVNAEMGLSVPMINNTVVPIDKLDAKAKLNANIVIGPFDFSFRKSEIQVSGEHSQTIQWRYNFQSAITGTHDFKCMMILKIAREAQNAKIKAGLSVVPAKEKWLFFKKELPQLNDFKDLTVELAYD